METVFVQMTEPRLATHMLVSSLVRQMAEQGDFATVLHKGDPTAGALLILAREKGQIQALFERFPALDGSRKWAEISTQNIDNEQKLSAHLDIGTGRRIWGTVERTFGVNCLTLLRCNVKARHA
jgi:hypothetical protein